MCTEPLILPQHKMEGQQIDHMMAAVAGQSSYTAGKAPGKPLLKTAPVRVCRAKNIVHFSPLWAHNIILSCY